MAGSPDHPGVFKALFRPLAVLPDKRAVRSPEIREDVTEFVKKQDRQIVCVLTEASGSGIENDEDLDSDEFTFTVFQVAELCDRCVDVSGRAIFQWRRCQKYSRFEADR